MATHLIRDADGNQVGTVTAAAPTPTAPGRYLIEFDGAPPFDPWTPGFDPGPWIDEIGTRGYTIEEAP